MRALVQRVEHADVTVDGEVIASIGPGLLVLVGAVNSDTSADVSTLAAKLVTMRIFSDVEGKMNLSVQDTGGSVLVVSQFTLLADIRRGRRPSFTAAAQPDHARSLIDRLVSEIGDRDIRVESGRFGASMDVSLVNSGPVTIIVDVVDGQVA
ncbi:MAG: D-aminoacyl-tRNA deacylase [Actinomycetia bacterium]|nr:D-aminoacyl-tRNA deacylase [Actinomycetes bacterium]